MDIQELEKWVTETPEGKQWLEGQKKPLLDKRDELLEKVNSGNAKVEQLNQRLASLESDLSKEQAVNKEVLLSRPLAEKLKQKGVFDALIPVVSKTIAETYGLQLANGNAIGKVKDNETETELTLDQVIDTWSKSDSAKECFKPQEIKTESTSPDFKGIPKNQDAEYTAARLAAGLPLES
jgi:DNA repair exonuclease SbcCD ATPase subunit